MILMIPVTVTRMKMTTSWVLALPVGPTGPGQPGQAPKTCRCHLQLRVACSRRRIRLGAAGPGDSDIITGIRHSFHGLGRRDRRTLAHSECFLHFLDFGKGQTEEDSICNSKKLDRLQADCPLSPPRSNLPVSQFNNRFAILLLISTGLTCKTHIKTRATRKAPYSLSSLTLPSRRHI